MLDASETPVHYVLCVILLSVGFTQPFFVSICTVQSIVLFSRDSHVLVDLCLGYIFGLVHMCLYQSVISFIPAFMQSSNSEYGSERYSFFRRINQESCV